MTQVFFREGEIHKRPYHYKGCGLDDVYLINGYWINEDSDYGRYVVIRDLDGLHRAIGEHIVLHRKTLRPKEIRFLRKQLGLTQKELGDRLGQSSQQVARWEKNESGIPGPADRLIRGIFLMTLETEDENEREAFIDLLKNLDQLDETEESPAYFQLGEAWGEAA